MISKLALRNVKKSIKDYLLYFVTLTLAVCIFYVFNSLDAQKATFELSSSSQSMMEMLVTIIGYISIFISFVLGFLIVGANQFLIRRRKQEMGIYLLLGMKKARLALLLLIETVLIGLFSLGAGLFLGVFLSQWLSIFTASVFQANMKEFTFVFSSAAFYKTLLYFGLIFLVVTIVSIFIISKTKLITLFLGERQNQKPVVQHPLVTGILFVLSIICLGVAYYQILSRGLANFGSEFGLIILLGILGTFLFFASLSGFFLRLFQRLKGFYYKGLNFFILRQINARINSLHISLSMVCLMLFFTIAILSSGFGMNKAMEAAIDQSSSFDIGVFLFGESADTPLTTEKDSRNYIQNILAEQGVKLSEFTDNPVEIVRYSHKTLQPEALFSDPRLAESENLTSGLDSYLTFVKVSDYNRTLKSQGLGEAILKDDQVILNITGLNEEEKELLNQVWKEMGTIQIGQETLSTVPGIDAYNIVAGSSIPYSPSLIVPDRILESAGGEAENFSIYERVLQFNCIGDRPAQQEKFYSLFIPTETTPAMVTLPENSYVYSHAATMSTYAMTRGIIAFIGIYIGLVFLIASSAILALQQLSEVADNRRRYLVLQKVGTDTRLLHAALFKQTAIYFLVPLSLAIIHSIVGIKVIIDTLSRGSDGVSFTESIGITALLILAVYGLYFIATYLACRQMITRKEKTDVTL